MKVAVVGMGAVGTTVAANLVQMAEVHEIVAVSRNHEKAKAEILDLRHTTAFSFTRNVKLGFGSYADIAGSDVVVVTAGVHPRPGISRDGVLATNRDAIIEIVGQLERVAPEAIVLVVANPVDVIAQIALRHSGYDKRRLISTGTVIDSARLQQILGERVDTDPKNIRAYVIGDHSPTGFVPWSVCSICGMDVEEFCRLNGYPPLDRVWARRQVMEVAHEINEKKGNTIHGTSASICRLIRAIASDERSVLPVGTLLQGEYGVDDLVMSVPCAIGRNGVEQIINLDLLPGEQAEFRQSERHVRELVDAAGER